MNEQNKNTPMEEPLLREEPLLEENAPGSMPQLTLEPETAPEILEPMIFGSEEVPQEPAAQAGALEDPALEDVMLEFSEEAEPHSPEQWDQWDAPSQENDPFFTPAPIAD